LIQSGYPVLKNQNFEDNVGPWIGYPWYSFPYCPTPNACPGLELVTLADAPSPSKAAKWTFAPEGDIYFLIQDLINQFANDEFYKCKFAYKLEGPPVVDGYIALLQIHLVWQGLYFDQIMYMHLRPTDWIEVETSVFLPERQNYEFRFEIETVNRNAENTFYVDNVRCRRCTSLACQDPIP
jgi:hypothetical protein